MLSTLMLEVISNQYQPLALQLDHHPLYAPPSMTLLKMVGDHSARLFQVKFQNSIMAIVTYFVNHSVIDGLPSGDFKSISSAAEYLARCEFVQHLEVSSTTLLLHVRGVCLPAMRKDRKYNLKLALNAKTFDIAYASCGCPAGKGPSGSCKHIGALCYSLSDFCKSTCTDRLQSWNKP